MCKLIHIFFFPENFIGQNEKKNIKFYKECEQFVKDFRVDVTLQ